ncbi:GlxA family transcriptional regulator [Streptomyces boluensis]|uniref:Helix-turn-helix domain-containing protein n=1 Tax=Streptomyces boluensis TaxID=1775135 RepID=A0A964UM25_9ACTN|nr:helix-turn-helix domain-containing protein [Streptomyces boluensis]NBE50986.1 helix-turn-helix domain-containing protein [Streptomyces boluensis]
MSLPDASVPNPAPIRVAVLVLDETSLFELAVPCAVFGRAAADFAPPWYELTLCGTAPGTHHAAGGLRLETAHGIEALADADLVVVPACMADRYEPPPELLDALRAAHARGSRIASLCSGAFVLAEAGLLDGRTAATHWMYAEELRRRHPRVKVDEQALYIDDGALLTSAGTAAAIDLCLHIVRRDYGSAAAAEVGRRMVVAPHREGDQTQYVPAAAPAVPPRSAAGVSPVLDWALARLHRPLAIGELAERAGMSARTFGRHFTREVGTTPLKWLNQQRLARARQLLETTDLPVDSVAERSGLGSADSLRQHFHRTLGTTPAAYRRTFRGKRLP